ncbi:heme peroxidase [Mycena albidolilacea]|uniref:Peroxidase n=1 Tax=Mycena albidolilacea TaxID=1033008 RepID=A0AAD6ZVK3_9AGAR|nr:heme peroxidase [Mycena albidolilacea]
MLILTLLASLGAANGYIWPSPQLDALESIRFDQDGHRAQGISVFIEPCDLFVFSASPSGRADSADWIRTAYHDMATHNATDGTGGMDASIRFLEEISRPENAGDGFSNTINVFLAHANRYVSIADTLALALIMSVENCGGPEIAFRGGRVDAGEPNAPGVPEPQQDLQSHIDSFARQGFTQTEMIGLVACGHSFGGVEHAPFPDIVPDLNDPTNLKSVAHFDSTFAHFDNNVATEYISGTTQNPLVVGSNDITNSDKRIFSSDGNATMLAFANSPELFASTCATLFARMVDTVPRGVQLTEVIKPLPVKPDSVQLVLNGGTLQLSGEVRFWNTTADPNRVVSLLWDDHVGGTHTVAMKASGTASAVAGRYTSAWYAFNSTVDPVAGITSMRFLVDGTLEDQGGVGFAVQDGIFFTKTSCITSQSPRTARFDVAVRNGLNPTRLVLEQELRDNVNRPIVVTTEISSSTQSVALNDAYSLWSGSVVDSGAPGGFTPGAHTIRAEVGGLNITANGGQFLSLLPPCPV